MFHLPRAGFAGGRQSLFWRAGGGAAADSPGIVAADKREAGELAKWVRGPGLVLTHPRRKNKGAPRMGHPVSLKKAPRNRPAAAENLTLPLLPPDSCHSCRAFSSWEKRRMSNGKAFSRPPRRAVR